MKGATIYLCGPIADVAKQDAVGWRIEATDHLEACGNRVKDPTKWGDGMGARELVDSDKRAIDMCDIILWNSCGKRTIGSLMELEYASHVGCIVYGVIPPGSTELLTNGGKPHPWILAHTHRLFPTLEALLKYIEKL